MKKKTAMVLEGGGNRGMFTIGVLDTLMEANIDVDIIIGVSAGALYGVNYFSNQKGRAIRYSKNNCGKKNYMSITSLLKTGNLVNKEYAFYEIPRKIDPLDVETFLKNKKDFYVTVTNINTGKPEYLKIDNPDLQIEEFRATSALPMLSEIININGKSYMDGGISDSIPVHKIKELKCDKIIVVQTQPYDYVKPSITETKKFKIIKMKYKKYPKFIKLLETRHDRYNKLTNEIKEMEKNKEIFCIRPEKQIKLSLMNKEPEKLEEIYQMGVKNTLEVIDELKKYLK